MSFPLDSQVRLKRGHEKDGIWTYIGGMCKGGQSLSSMTHWLRRGDEKREVIGKSLESLYERVIPEIPPFTITTKSRVVIDYTIEITGHRFDAGKLSDILFEIFDDGDVILDGEELGKVLKSLGVLDSLGSHRHGSGARPGPNFKEFYKKFDDAIQAVDKSQILTDL